MIYEKSTGYVYEVKSYGGAEYYSPLNYCPILDEYQIAYIKQSDKNFIDITT